MLIFAQVIPQFSAKREITPRCNSNTNVGDEVNYIS